jgi:hypothetical protein
MRLNQIPIAKRSVLYSGLQMLPGGQFCAHAQTHKHPNSDSLAFSITDAE